MVVVVMDATTKAAVAIEDSRLKDQERAQLYMEDGSSVAA